MHALLDRDDFATVATLAAIPPRIEHRLEFDGRAGEYFRIWIVNVALSLVTLGIYSAWAKVRTERYFYGNTRLDGVPFEYSAQPLPILRGRLIAAALFGAYLLTAQFAPIWNLAVVLLILVLTPLIIVSGLRFRARYSAWRGIPFRFAGGVGAAYGKFLGLPVLAAFTMFLLYPWVKWRQQHYVVTNHRFGREPFAFDAELGPYYAIYGLAFLAWMMLVVLFVVGVGAMAVADVDIEGSAGAMAMVYAVVALMYLGYFAMFVGIRTALTNLLWNHASLGPHRFRSTLGPWRVIGLFLGNAVAIVISLGLLVPWAKVRLAKYRAEHWTLIAQGDLGAFAADAQAELGAAGAEVGEAFDIDLSI